jgi:hypothetical protein
MSQRLLVRICGFVVIDPSTMLKACLLGISMFEKNKANVKMGKIALL